MWVERPFGLGHGLVLGFGTSFHTQLLVRLSRFPPRCPLQSITTVKILPFLALSCQNSTCVDAFSSRFFRKIQGNPSLPVQGQPPPPPQNLAFSRIRNDYHFVSEFLGKKSEFNNEIIAFSSVEWVALDAAFGQPAGFHMIFLQQKSSEEAAVDTLPGSILVARALSI